MDAKKKKKVLLIDDDPTILALLQHHLETKQNRDVVTTTHPSMTLQLVQDEKPDLIVCDLRMDERPGFQVAADLAGDEAAREIPFLFLSALVGEELVDKAGTMQGIWMISKLSGADAILARIADILDRKDLDETLKGDSAS